MYFQSKLHEQKFNEMKQQFEGGLANDQLAFVYLATSDILREAKLINLNEGYLLSCSDFNPSYLSSSQVKLARLALHLFNSVNEIDGITDIIDSLDMENRKLMIQAIVIRAGVCYQ